MIIDFNSLSKNQVYYSMIQSIIPRPIAWVLTENEDRSYNLAPFSYFSGVCSEPPLLMISVGSKRDGSPKDTWRNIEERHHFVVHIPGAEHATQVDQSSLPLAENESEVESIGLETCPFPGFSMPRLSLARIAFACNLESIHLLGENKQAMILGRVHSLFVSDQICQTDGKHITIDPEGVNPLSRLGGKLYSTLGNTFEKRS